MDMKPASGKSHAARRIRKRPFRLLAAAATVLAASVLVAGCNKEKQDHRAEAEAASQEMQSSIESIHQQLADMNEARINQLRRGGEEEINKLEWEMRGKITHAKRRLLLSGIVDTFQTMNRAMALAADGNSVDNDSNKVNPLARKEDSLFIRKGIMKRDSMDLVEAMNDYLKRSQPSVVPTRWRGSPISAVFNSFKPMLPEARDRHRDSLLLRPIVTSYVEWENGGLMDWLRGDDSIMDKYEKMKLPDGLTRKQDGLRIAKRFAVDPKVEKEWQEHLAEEHYKKWGNLGNYPSGGVEKSPIEPHRSR
jgi:hypothetical protein